MHAADAPADALARPETLEERLRRFSLFAPWLQQDPVSGFAELREHGPVLWSEEHGGFWILTRYEDVEWAARNPDVFSSAEPLIPYIDTWGEKQIPLQLDGEVHRKWRQTLSDTLSPASVNHFTPHIRAAAVELSEKVATRGGCELVSQFAVPLPAEAFLVNFGIDRSRLQDLLDYKNWFIREAMAGEMSPEAVRAANRPLREFFAGVVQQRRSEGAAGREDFISRLICAPYDGRPTTDAEIVNAAFVSMMASLDTTTAALGLSFLWLAEHPEVQRMIVAEPARIPAVVEELLRHEPVLTTARIVTRDVECHGVVMRRGDKVLMSWGMTGRDPDAFERPDEVDFDRTVTRQLAFGVGPHRCLGMHLARRILSVALEEWHSRIPRYHVTSGSSPLRHYSPVRGVAALELTVA